MKTVPIQQASKPLGEYASELKDGIVVVTKNGRAVAALVPLKHVDKESIALNCSATSAARGRAAERRRDAVAARRDDRRLISLPSWRTYAIAMAAAATAGFLLALIWLPLTRAGIAGVIAACGALVGIGVITTIVEGAVYAAIVCGMLATVPKPPWVILFIGAAVGGACVGSLSRRN
jgi:antitoxin (DNA-binding transcriptional repressor) of toxin-antitoxin stability system